MTRPNQTGPDETARDETGPDPSGPGRAEAGETTLDQPGPEAADSELYDTGGELDTAHDPAAGDGPHLTAAAAERNPGTAAGLMADG